MRLFFYYCTPGFSNCYVLGTDEGVTPAEAVIVDPGSIDSSLIHRIEDNGYDLRGVFVTHDHRVHVNGLRTLKRIYDVEIFAVNDTVSDFPATRIKDGDTVSAGPFRIEVLCVPGHSSDSAVFLVDRLLFTGDAMTSGLVGPTASAYGSATQMLKLRGRVLSLPGDYTVLPGHGPPSSLEAERRFNADIANYRDARTLRRNFRTDP
ncbi:MAG: MBL fold metallo-hydrolase [Treponema sp.]|nr:MBL fold metallo-hydrolase [Treponema sp.]